MTKFSETVMMKVFSQFIQTKSSPYFNVNINCLLCVYHLYIKKYLVLLISYRNLSNMHKNSTTKTKIQL